LDHYKFLFHQISNIKDGEQKSHKKDGETS